MRTRLFAAISFIAFASFIAGFSYYQPKPWIVPDKAAKTVNPVKNSPESVNAGKMLWTQHCASCHGKTGKGDGKKAAQLKTQPADLSVADFQKQTDGSIYFKIAEGRDDMPAFKKKIADQEDIWNLVNFMRTLNK